MTFLNKFKTIWKTLIGRAAKRRAQANGHFWFGTSNACQTKHLVEKCDFRIYIDADHLNSVAVLTQETRSATFVF